MLNISKTACLFFVCVAALAFATSGNAQQQEASDARKIEKLPAKSISLLDAKKRIGQAKTQLMMDRMLLEKMRVKMNGNTYQTWVLRLDQRERQIAAKSQKIDDLLRTASQERKVRELTGAKFYEEQAQYYKTIYSDDIDMHLD